MRGAAIASAIVVVLVGITAFVLWLAWPKSVDTPRALSETEVRWLRQFARWERRSSFDYCDAQLRRNLPRAPTKRLVRVVELAGQACDAAMRGNGVAAFKLREQADTALERLLLWNTELPVRRGREASSHIDPRLSKIASQIAGTRVEARCWSQHDWRALIAEWVATYGRPPDTILLGFAEPLARARISLAPAVCAALARFVYGGRRPGKTAAGFDLAEALVVLAHEAEHIRKPLASEAVVECYAVQDVRPLVRRFTGMKAYATLMAGLAWEVAHSVLDPPYVARSCHNSGPLDLRPRDDAWP